MDAELKACTKCGELKPLTDFYRNRRTGARKSSCKSCCSTYGRAYFRAVHSLAKGGTVEQLSVATLLGDAPVKRRGTIDLVQQAKEIARDDAIAAVFAAARRWVESTDKEDRKGSREAVILRARQLIEAEEKV